MRLRTFLLLAWCFSGGTSAFAQEQAARLDGAFWLKMSAASQIAEPTKALFATGLLLGLRSAPALLVSMPDYPGDDLASLGRYVDRYLQSMPTKQVSEGLDAFYADYANRRITINDAAAVVLRRIVGDDEARINDSVKSLREHAAKGL